LAPLIVLLQTALQQQLLQTDFFHLASLV
jgi:hypothetical protein